MTIEKNHTLSAFIITAYLFLYSFSGQSYAQARHYAPLINAGDSINKGVALYDSAQYKEAMAVYKHISHNDTAYAAALVERSMTQLQLGKYIKAAELSREGLKLHSKYDINFYNNLGTALDDTSKSKEAVAVYKEALKEFPNRYLLWYNLGIAQAHAKDYDGAVKSFERDVRLNFYHASGHLQLGMIQLREGNIAQAMLSLQMFLALEPNTVRSKQVIYILEEIAQGTYKQDPKDNLKNDNKDDNFSNLSMIIKSKVALNSNYKATVKLKYDLVKQMQVFEEKLDYVASDSNFWMQTYVPYFNAMFKKGYFAPFVYAELSSVDNKQIDKWVKHNKGRITDFYHWTNSYIQQYMSTCPVVIDGKMVTRHCWYFSDNNIQVAGEQNNQGKLTGMATVYSKYGNVSAHGMLDDQGNKQGTWKWYYTNGALEQVSHFKDDKKNGKTVLYQTNGVVTKSENYVNDSLDGPYKEYFNTGEISVALTYKNGKKEGRGTFYTDKGTKQYSLNYKDSKLDGKGAVKEYYLKGKLKSSADYVNGKEEGQFTEYSRNGKVIARGMNKAGYVTGAWKYYYKNGQLKREGSFGDNGNNIGPWKDYYKNGKLKEVTNYNDKGKLDDSDNVYNKAGIMINSFIYKNGKMESYAYYNDQGKLLSSGKTKRGNLHLKAYRPNGNISAEGNYVDGLREGLWNFYDYYGNISANENYKKGKLEGNAIDYFRDGDTDHVVTYKDGNRDGYLRDYYRVGRLDKEGWYKDGNAQGDWYFYNINNVMTAHDYYLNDNLYMYQDDYDDLGKLNNQEKYKYGSLQQIVYYDTTGTLIDTIKLKNGSGKFERKFKDGKPRYVSSYKDGYLNGPYIIKNEAGTVTLKGNYFFGDRDGKWQWNHANGKPSTIRYYDLGTYTGQYLYYNMNGKVSVRGKYNNDGDKTGKWYYYDRGGNIELINNYVDGNRQGYTYYYSGDSVKAGRLKYKNDVLTGFSYLGKDGKYVADSPAKNGSAHVVMYFQNGKKSVDEHIVNNFYVGKRSLYYPNGKLKYSADYKYNNAFGDVKSFYENGVMRSDIHYYDGDQDGKCTYYYKNGKVRISGHNVLDQRNGAWKYYDQTGKLVKTEIYYLGELYGVKKS